MQLSRDPEKFRNVLVKDLMKIFARGPGSFEIYPLPQDASMRRYYRLSGPELFAKSGAEGTIVLMVLSDPNPKAKSEEIAANGAKSGYKYREPKEEDLDFVNVLKHFEKVDIPVPRLFGYNIGYGLLYLEDLGDDLLETIQDKIEASERRRLYFQAIDHVIQIHEKATALKNPGFVGFKRAFDENLLFRELTHYIEYGIEARKNTRVDAKDMNVITKHMKEISAEIAAEPRVVVHRDFQSRNLLLKNGRLRVIDFQDALMGARQYDLVSLLRDSYVVLPTKLIEACIVRYCKKIEGKTGAKIDRERFMRVYHLQTLQRKIKDAGRFDYIDIVKKNRKFLQYIPATLQYVRDAFAALPEHRPMQERLAKYTPELAP